MNRSMFSIGPGRYSAIIAAMSPMDPGFSFSMYRCMPADSSWKTSVVLPEDSSFVRCRVIQRQVLQGQGGVAVVLPVHQLQRVV